MAPGNGSQGRRAGNGGEGEGPSRGFRPASAPRSGSAPRRPGNGRKTALVAGCAAAAVLAVVYLAGAFTFMDRFMPRTTVMGEDVSFKTSAEVQDLLADIAKSYTLDVSGQGFSLKLTSADMGTGINVQGVTDAMHADANPWAWPVEVFGSRDETDRLATSNGKLDQAVRTAVDALDVRGAHRDGGHGSRCRPGARVRERGRRLPRALRDARRGRVAAADALL